LTIPVGTGGLRGVGRTRAKRTILKSASEPVRDEGRTHYRGRYLQRGRWTVDSSANRLFRADREVRLEPKIMRVLGCLVEGALRYEPDEIPEAVHVLELGLDPFAGLRSLLVQLFDCAGPGKALVGPALFIGTLQNEVQRVQHPCASDQCIGLQHLIALFVEKDQCRQT